MLWNGMCILAMGMLSLYMFNKGHYAGTRALSLVPMSMTVVDICLFSVSHFYLPILGIMMEILRFAVIICCAVTLRRDSKAYANRKRTRAKRRIRLCEPTVATAQDFRLYA